MPAVQHVFAPRIRCHIANIDNALFGQKLQNFNIADAGLHRFKPVKHPDPCIIRTNHLTVGIKEGKAILDGFNRMPQAALGNLKVFIGHVEIGFNPLVFIQNILHLGAGLNNLIRQLKRVIAKLAIGRLQLGLFLFKQAFRRQPRAAFFR